MVPEENRNDEPGQSVDLVRGDSITLSSVPQQRRMRDFQDEQMENVQQVCDFILIKTIIINTLLNEI